MPLAGVGTRASPLPGVPGSLCPMGAGSVATAGAAATLRRCHEGRRGPFAPGGLAARIISRRSLPPCPLPAQAQLTAACTASLEIFCGRPWLVVRAPPIQAPPSCSFPEAAAACRQLPTPLVARQHAQHAQHGSAAGAPGPAAMEAPPVRAADDGSDDNTSRFLMQGYKVRGGPTPERGLGVRSPTPMCITVDNCSRDRAAPCAHAPTFHGNLPP
jgi:hypothetical protein